MDDDNNSLRTKTSSLKIRIVATVVLLFLSLLTSSSSSNYYSANLKKNVKTKICLIEEDWKLSASQEDLARKVLQKIPVSYPVRGAKLTSKFGYRNHPIKKCVKHHDGIDLSVPTGTPVKSTVTGVVIKSEYEKGYGNVIEVKSGKYKVRFAHLSCRKVQKGDKVFFGTLIGKSGNTGLSTGPHLHYEVRYKDRLVNPLEFVK